jgi:tetratricopeptide (TPR) repeat protein
MEADLGAIAWYRGDLAAAERHLEDSLAQFRQLGGHARMDLDLHWLGRVAYSRGNLARARELLEQSVALGRETGFHRPISYGLQYLGLLARASGDLTTAARQLQEALALYQRAGDREGTAGVLEGLAGLALDCGEPELAARLFGAAERLRESIGAPLPPVSRVEYERDLATLRCALPAEALATAWQTGRAISIEHAAKGAMTLLPRPRRDPEQGQRPNRRPGRSAPVSARWRRSWPVG